MIDSHFNSIISHGSDRLIHFVNDALARSLEPVRLARASKALLEAGSWRGAPYWQKVAHKLLEVQRPDGGWSDPEETAWACGVIRLVQGESSQQLQSARQWLSDARQASGGWGRHPRDQARIPITGLIAALLPEVITPNDLAWLEAEWRKDFQGPVRLSYKAGFFLLAMAGAEESQFVTDTLKHLEADQNDDGGFAPWKGHPMGSDPWSTGVVLWGLSKWPGKVSRGICERALQWLASSQLPSGYWPCHYLDDGSSLALIGATSALRQFSACAP